MNVSDFMAKHGITDADLDRMAAPYEDGSFEPEPDGKVFSGSHLDAVGKKRVTVVYDAQDTQRNLCRHHQQRCADGGSWQYMQNTPVLSA